MQGFKSWADPISSVVDNVVASLGGLLPSLVRDELMPLICIPILCCYSFHCLLLLVNMPCFEVRLLLFFSCFKGLKIPNAIFRGLMSYKIVVLRDSTT